MASSNKKNLLLILFVVVNLIIFWRLVVNSNTDKYEQALKVAVNLDELFLPIDPSNNPTLTNAFFSNNLYSNLIEVDENNNYKLDLASRYWFDTANKKVFFELQNSRVSSADAAFSLKRIIIQNSVLHSDFWNIICAENESSEKCSERIYVENDLLVLKYESEPKSKYIIPTLASVDYKIVPIAAFDVSDFRSAKIVDYKVTSGHYHMLKKADKYFFVRNKTNLKNIYSEYELVNMNTQKIDEVLRQNKQPEFDIISSTIKLLNTNYIQLKKSNWEIFSTHNINITMLVFSKNGIEKTTPSERFSIAGRVAVQAKKLINIYGAKDTIEFFQDFGQGYLSPAQSELIAAERQKNKDFTNVNVNIGLRNVEKWKSFFESNLDIEAFKISRIPMVNTKDVKPDLYPFGNDVSFDLNLSLISYAANIGLLDMSKAEVQEFANLTVDTDRNSFINLVHYNTLKKCLIYPMWASPYTTAFYGKYEHSLSKFNSRTLLWKIH